eukprot:Em0002g908a
MNYINLSFIPTGSVEVESLLSTAKYIATDYRARLLPVTLEMLMFLKHNRRFWDVSHVHEALQLPDSELFDDDDGDDEMLDASKENCIHIPTGGTPLTLAHVTVPKAPITHGSSDDSGILFENEVRALSADQRQQLLHSAGIKLNIEPTQGLAIKSMIGLPWYRLRTLSRELIGDNLEVELAPFSFKLADGGEEIRGAAHTYTPSLTAKITQLLEQNEMYNKRFRAEVTALHTMKWKIDLKLALYCPTAPLSRSQFDEYSKALKDLSGIGNSAS